MVYMVDKAYKEEPAMSDKKPHKKDCNTMKFLSEPCSCGADEENLGDKKLKPILLPCPFCGGEAQLLLDESSDYRSHWEWYICCTNGCPMYFKTEEEAITAWNTRKGEKPHE